MLEPSRSMRSSMAFAEWRLSSVVDNIDRFLMNFSIVIWWAGVIRRRSFKTPKTISKTQDILRRQLTFEDDTVCNHFFDIILCLRKQIENVNNATGHQFRNPVLFIENTVKNESQGRQDLAPGENAAKVVLWSRALLIVRYDARRLGNGMIYLKLKHIPNAIDANKHQVSRFIVVLIEEFYEHVETTGTDKHLKGQCRSLVHLPHKCSCFKSDLIRVLPGGKFCDNWDSANEAQIFLDFNVIENDLDRSA